MLDPWYAGAAVLIRILSLKEDRLPVKVAEAKDGICVLTRGQLSCPSRRGWTLGACAVTGSLAV